MNLIIIHRNNDLKESDCEDFLRFAWSSNPLAKLVFDGFSKYSAVQAAKTLYALPQDWSVLNKACKDRIISYDKNISIPSSFIDGTGQKIGKNKWFVISNGRFFTKINQNLLNRVMNYIKADVVLINAEPGLLGEQEKIRMTDQGKVAGFRRLYSDSTKLCPVPDDWPAFLFVKPELFKKILVDNSLPLSFSEIIEICKSNSLKLCSLNAGGVMLDIGKEDCLLEFSKWIMNQKKDSELRNTYSVKIPGDSRLTGKVLLGKNVRIGAKVLIAGPAVIGDNSVIEENSLIYSSILGPNVVVNANQSVQNRICSEQDKLNVINKNSNIIQSNRLSLVRSSEDCFRNWPKISYPGFLKRIADIVFALIVLTLFVPLFPFIAIAIKLTSPGPVFYGDKRQGLHGKNFRCLKFRTMITGANEIQQKLRHVSQVDGPQFKMEDDPRINFVGRFLRETYIDEIPQFLNVLFGQMSVVGPRPSPESENTLCPSWRDARLSVRPGITGLWQLYRTREPMKDFQEWIYYDTEYVKKLSVKMDFKVCLKTAQKMLDTFINQF
ncbi:MAG: sugar transferase [Sedimentisphaerales bacterium]|nr:sugar transferase [Sedimentisphaerales bacterium]